MVFGANPRERFLRRGCRSKHPKDHENMATAIEFWAFVASEEEGRRKEINSIGKDVGQVVVVLLREYSVAVERIVH